MDEVVYASQLAFKIIEDPASVRNIGEFLAVVSGIVSLLTMVFPKIRAESQAGDSLAWLQVSRSISEKASALFEQQGEIAENARVIMTAGIAVGFFWYALFAAYSPFVFFGIEDKTVISYVNFMAYFLTIMYVVNVIANSRYRLFGTFLLFAGCILGVVASVVFVVVTHAYSGVSDGQVIAGSVTIVVLVTMLLIPFLVKRAIESRQEVTYCHEFLDVGFSAVESNCLAHSLVRVKPLKRRSRPSLLMSVIVLAITVLICISGLGLAKISEPLNNSEGVCSVEKNAANNNRVIQTYNLLGKVKKEVYISDDGAETVYFQTIRMDGGIGAYEKYEDGVFKSKASADYASIAQLIEGLNAVAENHGKDCMVYGLSADGSGAIETSLSLKDDEADEARGSIYEYATYDKQKRCKSIRVLDEHGNSIDDVLEFGYVGNSDTPYEAYYFDYKTNEMKYRGVYERTDDMKVRFIYWYDQNGKEIDVAVYSESGEFVGWKSKMY